MSPHETLTPGTTSCGFTVERTETISELDADAYVLRHKESGARLLYLACDDENKAFAIAFKTPPANSTGVFHILEHSVLCGSAKFPVKEPFVDLIKSSMQTFLNAMTYPDKTIYPVASTNEQDLLNLMDVYMDAVLNPMIYTKPTIFQQEGWHYELDVPEGASLCGGELRYNGVVFNEMKGALSDPMSVLDDAMNAALFPNTPYAFESGGDPRCIPQLTYDEFLDTHARHYNLANSYIVLYGDFADVRRELAFLDERYLSRANAASARIAAKREEGAEEPALAPNPLPMQQPIVCDYRRVEMETTPENALVGMAYVIGQALDVFRTVAADVLFEAILGSNEAPVKKAIIEAGLGGNVTSYTSNACQQPYEMIMLQNAKPDAARELRRVIEETCRDLVEHGVPRDRLEAVISNNEYSLRQRDYGVADGVALACDALSTWLYDDDAATDALKLGTVYAELRDALEGNFFEDLLQELVLDSEHWALVELVPVEERAADDDPGEAAELQARKAAMTEADLQSVVDQVAELRRQQEAEDTPEDRAKLPRLHVADIGDARPEPPFELDETMPLPCLRHHIATHRLAYALTYFDLSHLSFAELPYAKILCRLMQQLPTAQRTAAELDSYIGSNLGFLSFTTEVYLQESNWRLARPVLLVSAGALSEKIDALANIPREVWAETLFEDTGRIRDVLTQMRIGMEQAFLNAGHQAALGRALTYVSPAAVVSDQLAGVEFYRFLRDLLDNFDDRIDSLCDTLRDLQRRIFTSTGTIASFTGSDEDYARYWYASTSGNIAAFNGVVADIDSYRPGMVLILTLPQTNAGGITLNINDLGAKAVKKYDDNGSLMDLEAGDFVLRHKYFIEYDGTQFVLLCENDTQKLKNLDNKIDTHMDDEVVHITGEERTSWNGKSVVTASEENGKINVDGAPVTVYTHPEGVYHQLSRLITLRCSHNEFHPDNDFTIDTVNSSVMRIQRNNADGNCLTGLFNVSENIQHINITDLHGRDLISEVDILGNEITLRPWQV
ncbi:insulinase family protein, partial [uncultured Enorma sp.]|uniref:insulinase family protein n=1 Tax=uncultured Enorma sp. TaxID=1714346 RepID=UPI0028047BAF